MKKLIFITMLLGVGYSQDCDPEAPYGWNCDCNEDTWQEYYNSEGHNMVGCWLPNANLYGANLEEANLDWANLEGAILTGAILTGANLYEANLTFANLTFADLSDADLSGANLSCAILSWADLNYTNLGNTTWDECGITDENGDGYDDVSYEAGYETGATSGDLNLDGVNNVMDAVMLINIILNP